MHHDTGGNVQVYEQHLLSPDERWMHQGEVLVLLNVLDEAQVLKQYVCHRMLCRSVETLPRSR